MLWWVAGSCLALSSATFLGILAGQRLWPNTEQQQRVCDLGSQSCLHARVKIMGLDIWHCAQVRCVAFEQRLLQKSAAQLQDEKCHKCGPGGAT